jgi:tetratricopeptide (TPR) repeat protein
LEGGNTKFAYSTLSKLMSDNQNLHEVANQLESAIELYPDRSEFRLLLSETYSALGEKEKSLAILQYAQKNITL